MNVPYSSLKTGLVHAYLTTPYQSGQIIEDRGRYKIHIKDAIPSPSAYFQRKSAQVNQSSALVHSGGAGYAIFSSINKDELKKSVTLSAWVCCDGYTSSPQGIFSYSQGTNTSAFLSLGVRTYASTSLYFTFDAAGVQAALTSNVISYNTWYHVCGVREYGNTLKLYVNGVLIASASDLSYDNAYSYVFLRQIALPAYYSAYLNGSMLDARSWNRALTPQEVQLLATRPFIGMETYRQRRTDSIYLDQNVWPSLVTNSSTSYDPIASVGWIFPTLITNTAQIYNATVQREASLSIVATQVTSTSTIELATVVQESLDQIVSASLVDSTSEIYSLSVAKDADLAIATDQVASTTDIYSLTVSDAADQYVSLDTIDSVTDVYLAILIAGEGSDTSDILTRNIKEEEAIAAQLLRQRQKQERKRAKKEINWQKKLLAKINGAETVEELDAITIQVEDVQVTAKVLEIVQRRKEAKRLELEIAKREAEVKILELKAEAEQQQAAYVALLNEQRAALQNAKRVQEEVLARHQVAIENAIREEKKALLQAKELQAGVVARHEIAVQKAIELERTAFLAHYEAEQQAIEFTRKRNNRIKRLKALMWLAKLDI